MQRLHFQGLAVGLAGVHAALPPDTCNGWVFKVAHHLFEVAHISTSCPSRTVPRVFDKQLETFRSVVELRIVRVGLPWKRYLSSCSMRTWGPASGIRGTNV